MVRLPQESRVLHFGVQPDEGLVFWADVDTDAEVVDRVFQVFGTGWNVPDDALYVGTTQADWPYTWHLFELGAGELAPGGNLRG